MGIKKLFTLATFLVLVGYSSGQSADSVLSQFFAIQFDDRVFIRWTIQKGNTCEDTHIERSIDGKSFERIGMIGGICGSPDASITYEFYDTMPVPNRVNYYRLELGLYGYTSLVTAEFILLNQEGYSLQPNPMADRASLVFSNPKGQEYLFRLYDSSGKLVRSETTTVNFIRFSREDLGSGVYIFRLESGNRNMKGKLVVE